MNKSQVPFFEMFEMHLTHSSADFVVCTTLTFKFRSARLKNLLF